MWLRVWRGGGDEAERRQKASPGVWGRGASEWRRRLGALHGADALQGARPAWQAGRRAKARGAIFAPAAALALPGGTGTDKGSWRGWAKDTLACA